MTISGLYNSLIYLYSTPNNAFASGIFDFLFPKRLEIHVASGSNAFQSSHLNIYDLGVGGALVSSRSSNYHFRYADILFYGASSDGVGVEFQMYSTYSLREATVHFKEMEGANIMFNCDAYEACAHATVRFEEIDGGDIQFSCGGYQTCGYSTFASEYSQVRAKVFFFFFGSF